MVVAYHRGVPVAMPESRRYLLIFSLRYEVYSFVISTHKKGDGDDFMRFLKIDDYCLTERTEFTRLGASPNGFDPTRRSSSLGLRLKATTPQYDPASRDRKDLIMPCPSTELPTSLFELRRTGRISGRQMAKKGDRKELGSHNKY